MFKFISKKLGTKIIGLSIILAIIICASTCIGGYFVTRNSMYKTYNEFAYQIGEVARAYVDGDKILGWLENGEDDSYNEMASNIYKLYKNTDISKYNAGIYIAIPDKTTMELINIYDVRVHDAPEEYKQYFAIGWRDPMGVGNAQAGINVYETGVLSDDYFIHETQYGNNSTAMLPIYTSDGKIVALLNCDMPMPYVGEMLTNYLVSTIIITVLVVAIFMFIYMYTINKIIVKPLHLIAGEAKAFAGESLEISKKLGKVKSKDEIGVLAGSILMMERETVEYMDRITAVTAEKERIGAELDVARNIQASMLPCSFPNEDELSLFATMNPAKEVGGDFYDFFMIDETHVAIVMADVSGKGVPAALFMVIGKTLIKDHTYVGADLGKTFTDVNRLLCDANSEGLFITAFEGVLDLVTGEFVYVNAGHEMPFIYEGERFEPKKTKAAFVLAGFEDFKYKCGSIMIKPGDRIFQYTDGVTEATDAHNQLYGMERLEVILNKCKDMNAEDLVHEVKKDIDKFVGEAPQFDDITMLCLDFKKYHNAGSTQE